LPSRSSVQKRTKDTLSSKDQERNPSRATGTGLGKALIEEVGNYLIAAARRLGNFVIVSTQEKERHMADDQRLTWGFILEVLDVLERHGYRRSDREHTGQAIGLIRHLARIYEGTLDAPVGGSVLVPSSPPAAPQPPGPPCQDAVIVSADEVKTLLAALDDAAGYKRDRAETCADCAGQSCTTCQWRLQAADTYDQLAGRMIHAAEAAAARQRAPGHAAPPSAGPHAAAGKEAGQ
jgi:hypothetical protein